MAIKTTHSKVTKSNTNNDHRSLHLLLILSLSFLKMKRQKEKNKEILQKWVGFRSREVDKKNRAFNTTFLSYIIEQAFGFSSLNMVM